MVVLDNLETKDVRVKVKQSSRRSTRPDVTSLYPLTRAGQQHTKVEVRHARTA